MESINRGTENFKPKKKGELMLPFHKNEWKQMKGEIKPEEKRKNKVPENVFRLITNG